jgi:hypothetical protein
MSLDVGNVDDDWDLEIVAGEHNIEEPSRARLYLFENAGGRGTSFGFDVNDILSKLLE